MAGQKLVSNGYNAVQNDRESEEWVILLGTAQSDQGEGMTAYLQTQLFDCSKGRSPGIQLQQKSLFERAAAADP
ncbi:hypothetical protein Tco_0302790 [Tanacetum coccineum]